MIPKPALDAVAVLVILGVAFSAGWLVHGWRADSQRLDQVRADAADQLATMTAYESTARETIKALQSAKEKQTVIRREVIREVEKYRDRPCFDPSLVRLLNDAAGQTDSLGADGAVPASPAAAD